MAVVVAGELRQVADPNRPSDHAFESPLHPGERTLRTLGESAHVLVVGGPTNPNGDAYYQVADDPFPGCCAPLGWVRATSSNGDPAIRPFQPNCPDPNTPITGNELLALGVLEASTCFGTDEFRVRGQVRCARPAVDSYVSITGPDWANDQVLCNIDQAISLYGDAVTSLYDDGTGALFDEDVELTAHFNDPSAQNCRWAPGNYLPIPLDNAPADTAQFACRMSIYVTEAALVAPRSTT